MSKRYYEDKLIKVEIENKGKANTYSYISASTDVSKEVSAATKDRTQLVINKLIYISLNLCI